MHASPVAARHRGLPPVDRNKLFMHARRFDLNSAKSRAGAGWGSGCANADPRPSSAHTGAPSTAVSTRRRFGHGEGRRGGGRRLGLTQEQGGDVKVTAPCGAT